jgi:hypothetical protein
MEYLCRDPFPALAFYNFLDYVKRSLHMDCVAEKRLLQQMEDDTLLSNNILVLRMEDIRDDPEHSRTRFLRHVLGVREQSQGQTSRQGCSNNQPSIASNASDDHQSKFDALYEMLQGVNGVREVEDLNHFVPSGFDEQALEKYTQQRLRVLHAFADQFIEYIELHLNDSTEPWRSLRYVASKHGYRLREEFSRYAVQLKADAAKFDRAVYSQVFGKQDLFSLFPYRLDLNAAGFEPSETSISHRGKYALKPQQIQTGPGAVEPLQMLREPENGGAAGFELSEGEQVESQHRIQRLMAAWSSMLGCNKPKPATVLPPLQSVYDHSSSFSRCALWSTKKLT